MALRDLKAKKWLAETRPHPNKSMIKKLFLSMILVCVQSLFLTLIALCHSVSFAYALTSFWIWKAVFVDS